DRGRFHALSPGRRDAFQPGLRGSEVAFWKQGGERRGARLRRGPPEAENVREEGRMRARKPDRQGYAVREGVRLYWELHGHGEPTVFLLPTWSIIHSRHWKFQVADLARHCRVLVMAGRGNGLSDRPLDPKAYADEEFAKDALAVMDDTDTRSAAMVSLSSGARWAMLLAAEHPERVTSVVFIGPAVPLAPWNPMWAATEAAFDYEYDEYGDWMERNTNYWRRNHRAFL